MIQARTFKFKYKCSFEIHYHEEFGFYAQHPQTGLFLTPLGVLSKSRPKYFKTKLEIFNFINSRSEGKIYDKTGRENKSS